MRSGRTTLAQVAEDAGVAPSTVSKALRGDARCASARTVRRIVEAARELGYQPNAIASALASGHRPLIGVALGQPGAGVYAEQLGLINREILKRGYQMLPMHCEGVGSSLVSVSGAIVSGMLDGLIVCTGAVQLQTALQELPSLDVPLVAFVENLIPDVPVVTVDRRAATYMATRYLMRLGHRRIAAVGLGPRETAKCQGYSQALEEEGLEPIWLPYHTLHFRRPAFKVGYELTQRLLQMEEGPTAALCSNDYIALGLMRALGEHGLQVPRDLSVVGFDGIEGTRYFTPALTTVRQPIEIWASRATEALFDLLARKHGRPMLELIPAELVVRESCGPPPPGS